MSLVLAEIVEVDKLVEVVWVSALAGVGVTVVYSVALAAVSVLADARREGRSGAAVVAGVVATLGLAAFLGAVVFGVVIMTHK